VSRGIALFVSRTFGTRWGCGVSPTPRPSLPPGKTRYTLYRKLGGHQDHLDGRKVSSPPGFDPGHNVDYWSSISKVVIPTFERATKVTDVLMSNHVCTLLLYLLTLRSRILLEKLTGSQLVK